MSSPSIPPGTDLSQIPASPPPPGVVPNFTNPETLSHAVVAVGATSSALAFILLSARLYSTIRITHSTGYDDYTAIAGFILSLAYTSIIISNRSFARHTWDLPLAEYSANFSESIFAAFLVSALAQLFAKLSILILFLRIFATKKTFRNLVIGGLLFAFITHAASIVVDGVFCAPWPGESFGSVVVADRCKKSDIWAIVQGSLEVILDFYIFFLPLPVIWKLQVNSKRKIGVSVIFMTALIACVASVIGVYYRVQLTIGSDAMWNTFEVVICAIVDINVAIMVACMPACAAFGRYFSSSIKSRLSSSKYATNTNSSFVVTGGSGSNGRYWRIKNPFSGKGEGASKDLMGTGGSKILHTVEFDVVQNKNWAPSPLREQMPVFGAEGRVQRHYQPTSPV